MWLQVLALAIPLSNTRLATAIQIADDPKAGRLLNASALAPADRRVQLSSSRARRILGWKDSQDYFDFDQDAEGLALEKIQLDDLRRKTAHRLALGTLTALIVGAAVPVFWKQGMLPFARVLVYLVSVVVVKLCVKQIFNSGFPYPYATTTFQMMITAIVACCIEWPTVRGARSSLTIAAVKSASLGLNNMALAFGTPAVASLIGAFLPATTYFIELWRYAEPTTPRTLGVLATCIGAMLCVKGEMTCSPLAVVLILGACFCRSLKTIWSYDFMLGEDMSEMSPVQLAAWTAIWCFVMMVPVTLIKEGDEPLAVFGGTSAYCKLFFIVGSLMAAGLNVLMCFVLKSLGPLLQNTYGQLELVVVLTLSVSWYQDYMGSLEWMGVILISLGCVLCNMDLHSTIKEVRRLLSPITEAKRPSSEPPGA